MDLAGVLRPLPGRVLWVVRHGESTWNATGRMQRQIAHPPLTARGIAQAHAAGYALQNNSIRRVISSDAVRAKQTAAAIAGILDVDVLIDARLRERGWASGYGPTSISRHVPERLEDPTARVVAALTDIAVMTGATAVVTHGDIVCAMLDILADRNTTSPWTEGTSVPNGVVIPMKLDRMRAIARPR